MVRFINVQTQYVNLRDSSLRSCHGSGIGPRGNEKPFAASGIWIMDGQRFWVYTVNFRGQVRGGTLIGYYKRFMC